MEIVPKVIFQEEEKINNSPAVDDSGSDVVKAPQEILEYFNVKPEDYLSSKEEERIVGVYNMARELFPEGNVGAIIKFIRSVETHNPVYGASESDRLWNVYKQFKIGTSI